MKQTTTRVLGGLALCALCACSLSGLVGESEVPAGTSDPDAITTEAGALGLYAGAIQALRGAVSDKSGTVSGYVELSGLLSDELRPGSGQLSTTVGTVNETSVVDSRFLPGVNQTAVLRDQQYIGNTVFGKLQLTRAVARQARGALRAYAPLVSRALIGHTYAVEAFAEILLAEGYCSGIPLSTVDFDGDFTLRPGSSTEEVYRHAIVLLDSAMALSADSARILDFARVAKGRALIAVADYAAAAAAVAEVPTTFTYTLAYSAAFGLENAFIARGSGTNLWYPVSVSDGEGLSNQTSIKYGSLNDPRAQVATFARQDAIDPIPYTMFRALKYNSTGTTPIVMASGVEARLIQAEAEFQAGGPWLPTLNALRTTCATTVGCATPAPAGSGGKAGLPPLSNPGTRAEQVKLLFQERALWLFLTGTRQGDMRRMIRHYAVPATDIYASGPYYLQNAAGRYGTSVNIATPNAEQLSNPLYQGCINRDA